MPNHKGGSKGKSKGKKNRGVEAVDRSGIRMKFSFLFSCLALRSKAKGSPVDNKQDGILPCFSFL